MPTPPVLLAVLAAEHVHQDRRSGQFTAVGIIRNLLTDTLPFVLRPGIGVYVAVTEVMRPMRLVAQLVGPDGVEVELIAWHLAGDPLAIVENAGIVGGVQLARAGRYSLRAVADGDMLGEWRFDVTLVGKPA